MNTNCYDYYLNKLKFIKPAPPLGMQWAKIDLSKWTTRVDNITQASHMTGRELWLDGLRYKAVSRLKSLRRCWPFAAKPVKPATPPPLESPNFKHGHSKYAGYLEEAVTPSRRDEVVQFLVKTLQPLVFDSVAVRGASGLTIGAIVAYQLRKNLVIVRKPEEYNHSEWMVGGDPGEGFVVVDDLVASGRTLKTIVDTIKQYSPAKCVGAILYHNQKAAHVGTRTFTPEQIEYHQRWYGCQLIA